MSFLMIPGIGLFVALGVRLFIAGVRTRPRDPTAVRRADEAFRAKLDRIAEEARRRSDR